MSSRDEVREYLSRVGAPIRVVVHEEELFLSLNDILKSVGIKHNLGRTVNQYKELCDDAKILEDTSAETWDPEKKLFIQKPGQKVEVGCIQTAKDLVLFALPRTTKSTEELKGILDLHGIKGRFSKAFAPPVGKDTVAAITRAIPWTAETEKVVGEYRVDLYFPELHLAVECDEYDHANYDIRAERIRERFIRRELECVFIRYDPYEKNFTVLDVIREILTVVKHKT